MEIPKQSELVAPVRDALKALGGSGTNSEIYDHVAVRLGLQDAGHDVMQGGQNPNIPKLEYRMRWARTLLKNVKAIRRESEGVWSLTELGSTATAEELDKLVKEWQRSSREKEAAEEDGIQERQGKEKATEGESAPAMKAVAEALADAASALGAAERILRRIISDQSENASAQELGRHVSALAKTAKMREDAEAAAQECLPTSQVG